MAVSERTVQSGPLSEDELARIDRWWRAANYLGVGQIYLLDNPLLREPLKKEHIKPRLLGHWGTTPGLNFVYAHLNRAIKARDLDAIYVIGPGHGGPAAVANAYLEGTWSEVYGNVGQDEDGMRKLFRSFSFPGGIGSHVTPEVPGSINEGGELGYSLAHAFGAAYDNPDLHVFCIVGDGEAETGPLAASWHSNKFLNPARDGAVVPILHLNGYKIANPTVLARITEAELIALFEGYGYRPVVVAGSDPASMHQAFARALDDVLDDIAEIKRLGGAGSADRPRWPMIILRSPKGWTGPKEVDGKPTEGTWRSHQVPIADVRDNPRHLAQLEEWLRSYRPEELFDETGRPMGDITAQAPEGNRRMSANPHANGGLLLHELALPDFRDYAVKVPAPGSTTSEATRVTGQFLRDVIKRNPTTFRLFGPDETDSNRLSPVFEATDRQFLGELLPTDEHQADEGRVMEVLSEHLCEGWLEGYLLTGRHGLFNCYEAFTHVVDSMFNQHAKWLKITNEIAWRRPIASLNYLLTSHVWRQDHNGFSHQDPGFLDVVTNKKAEVVRVYLAPDANTLLSIADHCLRSQQYVNVIVAGKQPALELPVDRRRGPACHARHRHLGLGFQRRRRSGRRDGGRRRNPDDGDTRRDRPAPPAPARPARSLHQRGRPDEAPARIGAPARHARRRVRHALHDRQTDHLCLPRLPLADPPPGLPAHQSRQPARARLQGGRHGHDAVRHGAAQRCRPLPPGDGRDRPRARPGLARRRAAPAHGGRARARRRPMRAPTGSTPKRSAAGPGLTDLVAHPRPERWLQLAEGERDRGRAGASRWPQWPSTGAPMRRR